MESTAALPAFIGVRVSAEQAAKLRKVAAADDRPTSSLIRRLLADGLARYETPQSGEVRG